MKYDGVLRQSYPGAKNPELLLYYTLKGKSNKDNAIKDYLATGKFESNVSEFEIIKPLTCSNPVQVNDPNFVNSNGWPLMMIQAPCAWSITKGNAGILIGVVDTEFRTTHEDWIASIGYNSKIAGYIVPQVIPYTYSPDDIRDGIWALHQAGVKVINVSWGGTGLLSATAGEITRNGTTLVLSGGNNPNDYNHSSIADTAGVIVVSSVDINNMHGPTGRAHNQLIDICAHGKDIMCANTYFDNRYALSSGSSEAAAFVSGTIALMLSVNPYLTPAEIENVLKSTADPIADGNSFFGQLGAGRLNAYAAVYAVAPRISGFTTIYPCNPYLYTAYNALPSFTWGCSSNLSMTTNGNQATVTASSSGSGPAYLTIKNSSGVEIFRLNITVLGAKPIITNLNGPSAIYTNGSFNTYTVYTTCATPLSYIWSVSDWIPTSWYTINSFGSYAKIAFYNSAVLD